MAFKSPEKLECGTAKLLAKLYNLSLQPLCQKTGELPVWFPTIKKALEGILGTTQQILSRNGKDLWICREVLTVGKVGVTSENENPVAQSCEVLWGVNKEGLKLIVRCLDFQKTSVNTLSSCKFGGKVFYGLKATWILGSKKLGTISHLKMERETSLQQQPKGHHPHWESDEWHHLALVRILNVPYLVGDVQFWSPHLLQSTVTLQKGQRNGLPSKKKLK